MIRFLQENVIFRSFIAPLRRNLLTKISKISVLVAGMLLLSATASWANFGAIAYASDEDAYGYSYGYSTRAGAEERAIAECEGSGGTNCVIATWERNACSALATGNGNGWGGMWGPNRAAAENRAIGRCEGQTSNCRARAWVCN